ncbi:hypothetical protein [Paenibacillus sp. LHD-38]|uniref:hypothetical protein n=1 Tax=Paenibacillus sp. LHD-38 TaxID=3072143 RepID=UPI00280CD824|nr:hypothetical protein [Paenibacillus sp. LHD-38]MDQ8734265.1 hypothetical protein [Paenibacillus sp. LHD-38]
MVAKSAQTGFCELFGVTKCMTWRGNGIRHAVLQLALDLVPPGQQPLLIVFQLAEAYEEQVVIDAVSFKQLEEALTLTFDAREFFTVTLIQCIMEQIAIRSCSIFIELKGRLL